MPPEIPARDSAESLSDFPPDHMRAESQNFSEVGEKPSPNRETVVEGEDIIGGDRGRASLQIKKCLARMKFLGVRVEDPDRVQGFLLETSDLAGLLGDILSELKVRLTDSPRLGVSIMDPGPSDEKVIEVFLERKEHLDRDWDVLSAMVRELVATAKKPSKIFLTVRMTGD